MHREIIAQRERLKRLFTQADQLQANDQVDEEVKAQFVWYLCIRTSGYVESSVKIILREYVQSRTGSTPNIANFVNHQLKRTLNPNRSNIFSLIGKFSPTWKENLKKQLKGKLGTSLDSIVNNRNRIAHGDNVNLSLRDLKDYFEDAQEVVELIYKESGGV